jgi:tRNA-splicing ligase RtcB (3'-phosphate/5'-hydroxy nucleic acid ligase)
MNIKKLQKINNYTWKLPQALQMRVPGIIFGDEQLVNQMDEKVQEQLSAVASLPGIVQSVFALPDAHTGYGFPIGTVAAFDPNDGGVVSAGGVGFDIGCGVRVLLTGLSCEEFAPFQKKMADLLFKKIPCGFGGVGRVPLTSRELDQMLEEGVSWAIGKGFGEANDLERIEMRGCAPGSNARSVSEKAKNRQKNEMGTLGSGNHYLEIETVEEIFDKKTAEGFGLFKNQIVVSIHTGSRGLGHQVATDYMQTMLRNARSYRIELQARELACAPIRSEEGVRYLQAMGAAMNCAYVNRQILSHFVREAFHQFFPNSTMPLLYDVSHNSCLKEEHVVEGRKRQLYVHRKGATLALPPGHENLSDDLRLYGQPIQIGGSMGSNSYILAGTKEGSSLAFSSACHGAGRQMSRTQALERYSGEEVQKQLQQQGIEIRCSSSKGLSEEAPLAYKNIDQVIQNIQESRLAKVVAKTRPLVCVKG